MPGVRVHGIPPNDRGVSYVKDSKHSKNRHHDGRKTFRGSILAAGMLVSLCGAAGFGPANAQATSGRIFGHAPAGETVIAQNATGLKRHVTVKSGGRYTITSLPAGIYTVVLEKKGTAVDTRKNIPIGASSGSQVDFACPQDKCDAP